ncbi:GGDEF domain-containing protein [uncultured Ilyobacter sp.]|uniref:GGDEF domain-containing protein n=1 Tax=uncultured Ilyobacter sp. TaxID=544433 RepID=UPI0029BFC687|nr:GGDEF domain-containing protein [uncultured Ilyobacter sp.]
MKKSDSLEINTPYLFLIVFTLILVYFDMSFPKIKNIKFTDIFSETLICIQPVLWIYFEKIGFKNKLHYYLMVTGLIIFYLGTLQDVLDEVYSLEGILSEIENIFVPAGLMITSLSIILRFTKEKRTNISLLQTNKMIYDNSIKDSLTGLYNRHYLEGSLNNLLGQLSEVYSEIAVAFIDIDNFKTINDTHGHINGDIILKNLGEKIKSCIRESDYAFRYGGDEFLIIYPNTKLEVALEIVERLKQDISISSKNFGIELSLSIGIIKHKKFENYKRLIDRADKVMYESKKNGKNQVTVSVC